jgi:lysine-specific demethylase/histidyl-hydroxylase NO66
VTRATPRTPATTARPSPRPQAAREGPADALALTLDPVDIDTFLAEHWERRPLVVPRGERGRFDGVLSSTDAERLICETAIRMPAFRVVRDGAQIAPRSYTEDIPWGDDAFTATARVDRVAGEFAAGATIVLQALHLHWRPAALYCRALEQRLSCPVQANAYCTPASAQGFGVHHDTHDVLILQVAGRKRWRIHAPVLELPLRNQRWAEQLGDPGQPVLDVTLQDGDTLYLPRGWPHEAATSDQESLHLTIGLHAPTRLDAVRAALDSCADDVEFRRSVSPDGALGADLLARLADRLSPEAVARRQRLRFVASRRPILGDQLAQVRALDRLTLLTPLERRPTVIADLQLTDTGAVLTFEGKEIAFPAQARAALGGAFAAEGPFTAAQLPGPLDEAGRLVLVRRLVREGFLRAPHV